MSAGVAARTPASSANVRLLRHNSLRRDNPFCPRPGFAGILRGVKPGRSAIWAGLFAAVLALRADEAADRHFTDRVKPLLDLRCVSCHGPDKVKGGLRLDSREALLKGGENGPAVVPGQPDRSLLIRAVLHSNKELAMPPKEKLTTNDIAVLTRWIREGAPWATGPAAVAGAVAVPAGERIGDAWHDSRNPIVRIFSGQRLDLWSLQPVKAAVPPRFESANLKAQIANPIDQFIAAKLAEQGMQLSPEADARTLIRRLTVDLTGLPPTAEEVEAFVRESVAERSAEHRSAGTGQTENWPSNARRSEAYERLVDRLLASPRYGEHQARLWLDVIRYSDSNGFDWDEFRKLAWQFRDYVIRAFNADKPFDRFIREQLAGDELIAGPPRSEAERDTLIATGYLRLGPHDNAAPLFNEQDRSRAELMADLVETTGSAFFGLTLGCCRCHDHKYDPLSQADHYRFRAFFEPVKFADDVPLNLAPEQDEIRRHNEALDGQQAGLEKQRDEILSPVKARLRAERVAKLTAEEKALLDLPKDKQTDELKEKVEAVTKKVEPGDKEVKAALDEDGKRHHAEIEKRLAAVKKQRREFAMGLLMTDKNGPPPVTKILFQGNHKQERDAVEPGFLSALDPNAAVIHPAAGTNTTGRRLTLAEWIASPTNPLTARVFVNRVWQQHFGTGIVETANDFGLAGARPTNPELLDWLAGEFVRGGWSVKRLHRLIVTSVAYRQRSDGAVEPWSDESGRASQGANTPALQHSDSAAVTDSGNTLLWRQNPRRLTAEQLRDALLATAGSLQFRSGGTPVWPDLPAEILQANPAFLDDNETKTKGWYPSPKPEQNVRSVFLVQKKTVRVPFMETFDLPENSVSCARRTQSTVAPQALSLLNSSLAVEAANAFAERVRREAGESLPAQVSRAFRLALQRAPTPGERSLCLRLAEQRSLPELCRALLNLNEFAYVD